MLVVILTIYCPKCGKELPDDAAFCDRCGQKMDEPVAPSDGWESRWERRMDKRFEKFNSHDYLDSVGFGVFLIGVSWVYLQYPWVWGELATWLRSWVNGPNMLPLILVEPITLFFTIMSGWNIVEGTIRLVSGRFTKGLSNIVSGAGGLAVAYLIRLYGQGAIRSGDLLPYFIILMGATIILSSLIGVFAWQPRRD